MSEVPVSPTELVSLAEVQTRTPSLDAADQQVLHEGLLASLRRIAPCFGTPGGFTPDMRAEVRAVLFGVLRRTADVAAWVESVTTGPYSTKFRADAGSVSVFTPAEEAALRVLCPGAAPASPPGGPRGSFPPPRFDGRFGW